MKDDRLLILAVYKGKGITPKTGWKCMVTAHLDSVLQPSDTVPLTTEPEFNTELSWDLSRDTLRKFKQNRVPLKVECLAVSKDGSKQTLGYIILQLKSAILDDRTEARWHKLLGGAPGPHKTPPQLLLSLNVLPASLSKDGLRREGEDVMEVDPTPCASPHGPAQDPQYLQALSSLAEGSGVTVVAGGKTVGRKQQRYNNDGDDGDVMEVPKRRSRRQSNHSRRSQHNLLSVSDDDDDDDDDDVEEVGDESEEEMSDVEEVREVGRPRRGTVINLRNQSSNAVPSTPSSHTSNSHSPIRNTRATSRAAEVQVIQPSDSPKRSYTMRNTRGTNQANPIRENGLPTERQQNRSSRNNNGELPVALPGPSKGFPSPTRSRAGADPTRIIPRMSEKGGFFQIGPAGEPDEQTFHFSVTIVFAKHLDQVVPSEIDVSSGPGVRFCYSLLGTLVNTDPIKDLTNPDFLAERAGGKVVATAANVSQYFTQHPQLPIHLLLGDVCLATANINLEQFGEDVLLGDVPMVVDGQHPLVPIMMDPMTWNPTNHPVLGVTVTLAVTPKEEPPAFHPPPGFQAPALREHISSTASVLMFDQLSNSDSSASDSEEDMMEVRGSHRKNSESPILKNSVVRAGHQLSEAATSWKHKRKALMYEAAREVETWKEGQQQIFWHQWKARESELQNHLSEEWESRVSRAEQHLNQRLDQCQTLHRRLSDFMAHLDSLQRSVALKEEKLKTEEGNLAQKKEDLKEQKRQLRSTVACKLDKREREAMEIGRLKQQLVYERQERRQLQREVREHEARSEAATRSANVSMLGSQVKDEEIETLKREKEQLVEQLEECEKKKQHYKMRWVNATSRLHQVLSDPHHHHHLHQDHRLDYDERGGTPLYVQPPGTPSGTRSLQYKPENHVEEVVRTPRRSLRHNSQMQIKVEPQEPRIKEEPWTKPEPRIKEDPWTKPETRIKQELRFNLESRIKEEPLDDYNSYESHGSSMEQQQQQQQQQRYRKDNKPGKSTEPKQLIADVIKGRQELNRMVRKRGSPDCDLYNIAINEATKKMRSLTER